MPRSRRTSETAERRSDLIDVASRQLNTTGVSPEWFGAIAEELGVSRPALYKHVADRDDLLFQCYLKTCEALEARLQHAQAGARNGLEVLDSFIAGSGPHRETAVLCEVEALPRDLQAVVRARRAAIVERLAEVVERGVGEGLLRPVDTAVVANAAIGMIDWTYLERRWSAAPRRPTAAAGMREVLFRGLAADRAAPIEPPPRVAPTPQPVDPFDRRALGGAKRETILRSASAMFNARGIGATRVEDVAAALGLSKRAIYHHVGQKAALVEACVERAYTFYLAVMDAAGAFDGSRLQAVFGATRDVVAAYRDPELSVLAPYVGYGLLGAEPRAAVLGYGEQLRDGYRTVMQAGERDGSIRPLPLEDILSIMPGVFSWASNALASSGDDRALADELATIVAKGILAT